MSKKVREAYERGYANGVREAAFQYLVTDREQQEREELAHGVGYQQGFDAGVAAAREAVAALEGCYDWPAVYGPEALAAIDALKEKP